MSENVITPNQIINNVATLDLRTTSEATLATIRRISDVATILYSEQTATHLTRLNMSDVAAMIKAPADATILSGQTTLGMNVLQEQHAPLNWIISGQLFVEASLSAEALDRGIESLIVTGQVLCPEHLAGVLQSKLKQMEGQFIIYPRNAILVLGKLTLTASYLGGLPDGSDLLVLGKLVAMQPLPLDLLAQKLGYIQTYGKMFCAEENSGLLRVMQGRPLFGEVITVPSGFELVEKALVLDEGMLETLSARKLYCTGRVHFVEDVSAETLERSIDKLVADRLLLAPSHLRKTLAQKCDLLTTKAIFYEGKLWLIEGEVMLDQAWFEMLEGEATLVVLGVARLDPALDPKMLATRLHRIHNLGEISASSAQLALLQGKTGINEGSWVESLQVERDASSSTIGNIAYLRL